MPESRSYHYSKNRTRSSSRERSSYKSRDHDREDRDRKSKKSKKSRKYARHSSKSSNSSTSRSSSPDSSRSRKTVSRTRESQDSRYGRSRHSPDSRNSRESSSRSRSARATSSESKGTTKRTATTNSAPKDIDLMDLQVKQALETIEEDAFKPKVFFSTRDREAPPKKPPSDKVIIDLNTETVTIPKPQEVNVEVSETEQIFHPNFIGDEDLKAAKWLRKLYNYRQKYFCD